MAITNGSIITFGITRIVIGIQATAKYAIRLQVREILGGARADSAWIGGSGDASIDNIDGDTVGIGRGLLITEEQAHYGTIFKAHDSY